MPLKTKNPFAISEVGGDIQDRSVGGFAERRFEGTSLGEPGFGTLRRVISQTTPHILVLGVSVLCSILLVRLYYLQVTKGTHYREVAEGNRIRLEVTAPPRGLVVDRSGVVLASNVPSFQLVAVPADLPTSESERQDVLTDLLADVPTALLDQENLSSLAATSYLPRALAYDLPHDLALALMVKASRYKGVRVVLTSERSYRNDASLGSVLGYVGKISPTEYDATTSYALTDVIGKAGLEQAYEDELRGTPGKRQVEVDAQGHERAVYASSNATPGAKLQLTIDSELQNLSYEALKRAVPAGSANGASVVVLNPKTGALLAFASYPSFDPNLFTIDRDPETITHLLQDKAQPFFNRPASGLYPAGSTIKPLLAAAGLEEGVITPQTTVMSTGGVELGDQFFADWKAGGHGPTTVYSAIAESVNTFFYLLGGGTNERAGLGISRIADYLHRFLIDVPVTLMGTSTKEGFIPTPAWKAEREHDRWYRGDTYNVSIGQGGLLVTPLHLALAYAALVNGGTIPQPQLVQSITLPSGAKDTIRPQTLGHISLKPEVFTVLKNAMRQTVTVGSARSLGTTTMAVAGKTGTAQTGTKTQPHGWFAGYAPPDNPEIVVVVMVERGGEGSSVAVPIAHEIFNWYGRNRAAQPQN
jgi:penicillin-binding protein 2